jgi:hypothetical protein
MNPCPRPRILVALALAALFSPVLRAQDAQAPELQSIALSPGAVDITTGGTTVTVTLAITDDDSGLNYGVVYLYDPADQFIGTGFFNTSPTYLQSGNPLDGVYATTLEVPPYGPAGTWRTRLFVYDTAGNFRDYRPGGEPFSNPGDELLAVTNGGPVDTQSPDGTLLGVTPVSVDVSAVPQTVTVELQITDDLVGFDYGFIDLLDPFGNYVDISFYFDDSALVGGDELDGQYAVEAEMPQGAMQGTWTLAIYLRDRLGNWDSFHPVDGEIAVVNSGQPGGGLADALDATQYPVTTGGDAEWFFQSDVTLDGIDAAQSGPIGDFGYTYMEMELQGPGTLSFWWRVDCEVDFSDALSVEVSGGVFYGEISGFVDWDQVVISIPPGPHTVTWLYNKNEAVSVGADAGWVDRVFFESDFDQESPVLQYFSIAPNPADISGGDVELIITLEVSDDSNGILEGAVRLYDPNGDEYAYLYFDAFDLIDGDSRFGAYQLYATLYQDDFIPDPYYATGLWRAEVEITEDLTAITRYYGLYDDPFPIPGMELFTVADGLGPDNQGPLLVSIDAITPNPADAAGGPVPVAVEFRVTDDQSGLSHGWLNLYNPGDGFVRSFYFDASQRVSGNDLDGDYQVLVTIPQYAPPGQWKLDFSLVDHDSNERNHPNDSAFPVPGSELIEVLNGNNPDTAKPVLQSIVISPKSVDASAAPRSVDVTLTITDDLSGLDAVVLSVYDPNGAFMGDLYQFFPGNGVTNGVFQKTLDIPQGSIEGTWTCRVYMRDKVGNARTHGPFGDPFPNPGDELFTVAPAGAPTTWENFIALHGLGGADALPGANPDKDWMINILELLLGGDPNAADATVPAPPGYTLAGGSLHLEFTIHPSLTVAANGLYLDVSDGVGAPFQVSGRAAATPAGPWSLTQPVLVSGSTYRVSAPVSPGNPAFLQLFFNLP